MTCLYAKKRTAAPFSSSSYSIIRRHKSAIRRSIKVIKKIVTSQSNAIMRYVNIFLPSMIQLMYDNILHNHVFSMMIPPKLNEIPLWQLEFYPYHLNQQHKSPHEYLENSISNMACKKTNKAAKKNLTRET